MSAVTCERLAAALGMSREGVKRWLLRLGRYRGRGSGTRLYLSDPEVVAVAVAWSVTGFTGTRRDLGHRALMQRAHLAAEAAANHPDAEYIVATPWVALPYETAEDAVAAWVASRRPP